MKDKHFMIDIETDGVDINSSKIMEVGAVEIEYKYPFWHPTGRTFHRILPHSGKPETPFQKQHQKELFKKCNEVDTFIDKQIVGEELRLFIHLEEFTELVHDSDGRAQLFKNRRVPEHITPKFFMGWNASNFDMPFLFKAEMLTPSYYEVVEGKEELRGDAHYRIYEQTGSLQLLCDMTGLDRKTIEQMAINLNPTDIKMPEGKAHDALYDCYRQIIMQNGLIQIGRMGIKKENGR